MTTTFVTNDPVCSRTGSQNCRCRACTNRTKKDLASAARGSVRNRRSDSVTVTANAVYVGDPDDMLINNFGDKDDPADLDPNDKDDEDEDDEDNDDEDGDAQGDRNGRPKDRPRKGVVIGGTNNSRAIYSGRDPLILDD